MSYDDFYSCEDRFSLRFFTLIPCLCFTVNTPFSEKLNHVYLIDSLYKPETMANTGSSRIVKQGPQQRWQISSLQEVNECHPSLVTFSIVINDGINSRICPCE